MSRITLSPTSDDFWYCIRLGERDVRTWRLGDVSDDISSMVVIQHLLKTFTGERQQALKDWVTHGQGKDKKFEVPKDAIAGTVPRLSILWVMDDHTGGPPPPNAEQADNDLAIGRIIY